MNVTVETYNLKAANGRHIRKATLVRFEDGDVIRFIERLSKREAIRQATKLREPYFVIEGRYGDDALTVNGMRFNSEIAAQREANRLNELKRWGAGWCFHPAPREYQPNFGATIN